MIAAGRTTYLYGVPTMYSLSSGRRGCGENGRYIRGREGGGKEVGEGGSGYVVKMEEKEARAREFSFTVE